MPFVHERPIVHETKRFIVKVNGVSLQNLVFALRRDPALST